MKLWWHLLRISRYTYGLILHVSIWRKNFKFTSLFVKFENIFVFVLPRTFKFWIPPQNHESQAQHLGKWSEWNKFIYFILNFLLEVKRSYSELLKELLRKIRNHFRELFSARFYQFLAEPGRAGRKITAMIHKRLLRYFGQFLITFYYSFDFIRAKHHQNVFRILCIIISICWNDQMIYLTNYVIIFWRL